MRWEIQLFLIKTTGWESKGRTGLSIKVGSIHLGQLTGDRLGALARLVPAVGLPLLSPYLWPWSELNCRQLELDVNSGRVRQTRHFWFVPVMKKVEETALSRAAAMPRSMPRWVLVNKVSRQRALVGHALGWQSHLLPYAPGFTAPPRLRGPKKARTTRATPSRQA